MSQLTPVRSPRDRLDRLLAITRRMVRFWWVGGLLAIVITAAVIGLATVSKKGYLSETILIYDEGIQTSALLGREGDAESSRKLGLRLKELVMARPRLQEVIQKFNLYPDIVERAGFVEAVDEMRKYIVFKVREGDTFLLSFIGDDPAVARDVTAALAQNLIEENKKYRSSQAEVTLKFIADEKSRNLDELQKRVAALAAFQAQHPEFAQDTAGTAQGGAAVRAAQKTGKPTGDPELTALEREANRIRQRLDMPTGPRAKPERDPRLVEAKQEAERALIAAQKDLADKQSHMTDQHPDVTSAKNQVRLAEERLRKAKENLDKGELILPPEPASAAERPALEARLSKVEAEIADVKRRRAASAGASAARQSNVAAEIVGLETEWARLNREVAEARERDEQLEGQAFVAQMESSSQLSGQSAQMRVVDPAYKPTKPTGGGRMKMALVGLGLGVALGLALMLALAIFDDRLYDKVDADTLEVAPLLAVVPRNGKRAWRKARV
jgi:hypothetical protein